VTHPVAQSLRGRPWLARATLAIVLVGFFALGARVSMSLRAPDLVEQKLAGAERYIYYRLAPDAGPKFELVPDDRSLRLVTHVVVPPGAYDPEREVEYGLRVVVDLGNGKAWTRDVYTRSRQSKGRWTGGPNGLWIDENTFVPGSSLQLTDDRLIVLALPAALPPSATARVTLLGDAREGYVRAYAPAPRDGIARRVRDLPDPDRARIAAQLGHLPWDRITAPEQLQAMRFAERRLSSEGKDGTDYHTRTLFTTAFRLRNDAALERGLLVTAAHGAAINVVGPARIDLAVTRPATPGATPPATAGSLELALVGEQPVPSRSIALPDLGARATHAIDVPAGVFTLTLTATAATRVELTTASTSAVLLGGTPGAALAPDEQLSTAFEAPVEIAVDGPPDLLSRVLRVDLRALASEPTLDGSAPVASSVTGELVIETLGEDGAVIATTKAPYESIASKLELAKLPGKLAASVCEPVSVRFVVPPGGRRVRISSDKRALVQVQTPIAISPAADRLEPPYDSVVPVLTRWRYARFVERGWLAVRPRAIAPEHIALLAAQARLEPREVPSVTELRGTSLTTGGAKQTIIERVAPEDTAEFIATWDTGHYTRLVTDKPLKLDIGRLPSRATIRYRADDSVGATARISVDGETTTDQVSSSRGSWRLAAGLTGTHEVKVDVDTNVALLVDRPPAAGTRAELYAVRTVSPISGRVKVKVEKRGAAQQNINIVLYTARAASAATVRVTIDGGAPARVSGSPLAMWTLADRSVPLPPSDRPATLGFADTQGGSLFARRVVVALGDDLSPGTHTIEIAVAGDAAWLRLFTLDGAAPAPRARQWREAVEESP
jgi:hypothetical protein